jgi:hypothetical protein
MGLRRRFGCMMVAPLLARGVHPMSRIRFATAQALFEAFPEVSQKIGTAASNQAPIDFLKRLWSDSKVAEAVTFCVYLLPRREAVWWACGCARRLLGDLPKDQAAGLLAAEAWVYQPDDEHRQAALDIGIRGDSKDAQTWLALAAGWSGGFLKSSRNRQDPVPPFMTARAARIAVLFSASKVGGNERMERLKTCIAEAIELAENGL